MRKKALNLKNYPTLVIGAGPVGFAFAHALKARGVPLLGITSRQKKKAVRVAKKLKLKPCLNYLNFVPKARLILIAVKDQAIEEVSKNIFKHGNITPGTFLAHTSGALSSGILSNSKSKTFAFSLHPLQSFSDSQESPKSLKGVTMVYEGTKESLGLAKSLTRILGGKFVAIPPNAKVIYHAAASTASNFLVTLAHLSVELNEKAGIPKKKALSILLPLMLGTLQNLKKAGLPNALTGPIQRGDFLTVQKHLTALRKISGDLADLYKLLSLETLKIAREKGLKNNLAQKLEDLLRNS